MNIKYDKQGRLHCQSCDKPSQSIYLIKHNNLEMHLCFSCAKKLKPDLQQR